MNEVVSRDLASLNRQFLILARALSKTPSGELVTGLPRQTLEKIASLTLDEIEALASRIGVSMLSLRLSEQEFDLLTKLGSVRQGAYAMAVVASK